MTSLSEDEFIRRITGSSQGTELRYAIITPNGVDGVHDGLHQTGRLPVRVLTRRVTDGAVEGYNFAHGHVAQAAIVFVGENVDEWVLFAAELRDMWQAVALVYPERLAARVERMLTTQGAPLSITTVVTKDDTGRTFLRSVFDALGTVA